MPRLAFALASLAVLWAALFTAWALGAPAHSSGETLLAVDEELSVRIAIAVPLVTALLVWGALHHACRRDSRRSRTLGFAGGWLLLAFSLVTGFSIGLLVLPAALALVLAAGFTPVRAAA